MCEERVLSGERNENRAGAELLPSIVKRVNSVRNPFARWQKIPLLQKNDSCQQRPQNKKRRGQGKKLAHA
jgi:hypothetical protein